MKIAVGLALFVVLAGFSSGARAAETDWGSGPFPRATTAVELAAYAGTASSTGRNGGGLEAGLAMEVCLFCIYTNDKRLAIGDYQSLQFGKGSAELREGIQVGYAINPDIDVVGRVYYQWYTRYEVSRDGLTLGAGARWTRFTGFVAFGPTHGSTFSASLRGMITRLWGVTAYIDRATSEGAAPLSGTSLRIATGMSF